MRIDHVIYATSDLAAGTAHCEAAYGVSAVGGGRHVGQGTYNDILPFSRGYLEVLAIADAEEAAASPLGSAVLTRLDTFGDGLFTWAVVVDDIAPVAARIGDDVLVLTRDGFSARLTGVLQSMAEPGLPFFIQRDHGVPDPGSGREPGLAWVEVAVDEDRLRAHLGDAPIDVRVGSGTPGLLSFGRG